MSISSPLAAQLHTSLNRETPTPGRDLTLVEWEEIRNRSTLSPEQMTQVVDRASALLDDLYVHKKLKREKRHAEPVSQLNELRHRLPQLSVRAFHNAMLSIYKSLGDVHTAYRLPEPFISAILFLPFLVKGYFDKNRRPRYVVTRSIWNEGLEKFGRGAEIHTWDNVPMEEAARNSTEFEEGSTRALDLALGLQFMTVRWLGASFEPRSPSVVVGYSLPNEPDSIRTCTVPWYAFVHDDGPRVVAVIEAAARLFDGDGHSPRRERQQAVNVASRVVQSFRRKLYAPDEDLATNQPRLIELARELRTLFNRHVSRDELRNFAGRHRELTARGNVVPSLLPAYLEASGHAGRELIAYVAGSDRPEHQLTAPQLEAISAKRFGYLRIRAFPLEDPETGLFKYELRRLLNLMPSDGLILDVRDNPGGATRKAEESLQFFTPNEDVRPVPFRFMASRVTEDLATRHHQFHNYEQSIAAALSKGGGFSEGFSITTKEEANSLGQHYFGPVILVTSGMTYSAGDIFAAGFIDNGIGPVLGVDETTGGGGGNCWFYNQHVARLLGTPKLPDEINMQIAARECTRIGSGPEGNRIEDTGVAPTLPRYYLTRQDVLETRPWGLLLRAATELAALASYDLEVSLVENGNSRDLTVRSKGIDRLEFQVNGDSHPVKVVGGITPFSFSEAGRVDLEIRGFADSKKVARYVRVFRG